MSRLQDASLIRHLVDRWGPVITLRDADAAGIPRDVLRRAQHREEIFRVGKSAFVPAERWHAAGDWGRFVFRATGFGHSTGPESYLSGPAAAMLHNIPVLDDPPVTPTAVRPGDAHRAPIRSVHGRTRFGYLPPAHRTTRQRVAVVSPAYAMVDIARHTGPIAGLMAADHLLHAGLSPEILAHVIRNMKSYPGIDHAIWALSRADARCESPLETLGRYAFLQAGRATPLSNVWISDGVSARRVDHLLPESGIVIEGDGDVKYNNRPDAAAIVTDEKDRQRWLERLDFTAVRYTYAIARYGPARLLSEVDRATANRRGRPAPTCWSFDPPWAAAA